MVNSNIKSKASSSYNIGIRSYQSWGPASGADRIEKYILKYNKAQNK